MFFDKNVLSVEPKNLAAVVHQDKTTLYVDASEDSRTKGYLIKGDRLRILEHRSGFLKITYESKKRNCFASMDQIFLRHIAIVIILTSRR